MQVEEIAELLQRGEVVALPTETVFGLAVSLESETGIQKLIKLKNRNIESGKVFTLVPTDISEFERYILILDRELFDTKVKPSIPGALTVLLPKNPAFTHPYFDHFEKIGLRIPDFPLFAQLLPLSGPLLLTSANPRDLPTAKDFTEVEQYFPGLPVVREPAGNQPASTIVDLTGQKPAILRQGALKF